MYRKLDFSIFNLDKISKLSGERSDSRDILLHIKEIVEVVLANEEKIIRKTAHILVYHFMKRIFNNLYFQEDKNAIEEFFSNSSDYKLSDETFVKYQPEI